MRPDHLKHTYSQEGDSDSTEPVQELTVEVVDAGGGHYLVLSTPRWAIDPDDLDGFARHLRQLLEMVEPSAGVRL